MSLCDWKCIMSILYCEAEWPVPKTGHGNALPLGEAFDWMPFLPVCILECVLPQGRAGWL